MTLVDAARPAEPRAERAPRVNPGRRGWYKPEHNATAYKLCLLGHTNAQLAAAFDVDESTLERWIKRKVHFRIAVLAGRDLADGEVAKSLYERAKGYSHEAVKIFLPPGAKEPVYAPYTEHYPPDTAAASLWLRNRQGAKWRDKTDVAVSGTVTLEALILASMKLDEAPADQAPALGAPSRAGAVIEGDARPALPPQVGADEGWKG